VYSLPKKENNNIYETPSTVQHACPSDPTQTHLNVYYTVLRRRTSNVGVHDPFTDFYTAVRDDILCVYDAVCRACSSFCILYAIHADRTAATVAFIFKKSSNRDRLRIFRQLCGREMCTGLSVCVWSGKIYLPKNGGGRAPTRATESVSYHTWLAYTAAVTRTR